MEKHSGTSLGTLMTGEARTGKHNQISSPIHDGMDNDGDLITNPMFTVCSLIS
ncbi:hypothetical protein ANCCAN_25946 [Ancylostoma caninum]|nr:hypothetical protein ANCCAN_25946 [Ancylostoma caninum]